MRELEFHAELESERKILAKAERDIGQGWRRLRQQKRAVAGLHAHGHKATQAERLVELTAKTLVEWERHRRLIAERIHYLEGKTAK
jgi:hypothetical protein